MLERHPGTGSVTLVHPWQQRAFVRQNNLTVYIELQVTFTIIMGITIMTLLQKYGIVRCGAHIQGQTPHPISHHVQAMFNFVITNVHAINALTRAMRQMQRLHGYRDVDHIPSCCCALFTVSPSSYFKISFLFFVVSGSPMAILTTCVSNRV